MTGWDREYLEHKDEYLELFDKSMQKEQEGNVEFLEDKLKQYTGRKYAVACSNGTDALHFALRSLDIKKGDEVLQHNFHGFLLHLVYLWSAQHLYFVKLIYHHIIYH